MPSNIFESCSLSNYPSGNRNVLTCQNFMGNIIQHLIHEDQFVMCDYHWCAKVWKQNAHIQNTIMCSGAIFLFRPSKDKFFNPLTPRGPLFNELISLPPHTIGMLSNDVDFYYVSEIQSSFDSEIKSLTCSDNMNTCITFTNNNTFCFGNTQDTIIYGSLASFLFSGAFSLVLGSIIVLMACCKFKYSSKFLAWSMFCLPIIGMSLVLTGVFLVRMIPCIAGAVCALTFITICLEHLG